MDARKFLLACSVLAAVAVCVPLAGERTLREVASGSADRQRDAPHDLAWCRLSWPPQNVHGHGVFTEDRHGNPSVVCLPDRRRSTDPRLWLPASGSGNIVSNLLRGLAHFLDQLQPNRTVSKFEGELKTAAGLSTPPPAVVVVLLGQDDHEPGNDDTAADAATDASVDKTDHDEDKANEQNRSQ